MDRETRAELAFWAVFLSVWTVVKAFLYKKNKTDNREPSKAVEGLIYSQQDEQIQKLRYGFMPMNRCGCAVIALYNAMQLLGLPADLSGLISTFQKRNIMVYGGVFGSNVWMISRAIRAQGLYYERVRLKALDQDGVYIIAFWNKGAPFKGSHAVCMVTENGIKRTYNLGPGHAVSMEDPQSYAGRRYICGYRIKTRN